LNGQIGLKQQARGAFHNDGDQIAEDISKKKGSKRCPHIGNKVKQ
jgi:hypothetical protein